MATIFDSILARVGSTDQKVNALESQLQEAQDWVQVHKNYIERYQRQIDEIDFKLEQLRRKTN